MGRQQDGIDKTTLMTEVDAPNISLRSTVFTSAQNGIPFSTTHRQRKQQTSKDMQGNSNTLGLQPTGDHPQPHRRIQGQEDSDFASLGPNPVDSVPSEMLRRPLEPEFISNTALRKMNTTNGDSEGKDVDREKEERHGREHGRGTGCATITLSVPVDGTNLDGSVGGRSD